MSEGTTWLMYAIIATRKSEISLVILWKVLFFIMPQTCSIIFEKNKIGVNVLTVRLRRSLDVSELKYLCHTFWFNRRPPSEIFVTSSPKRGLLNPLWIFHIGCTIPLYYLPLYSYGSLLFIDSKNSTSVIWRHDAKFWTYSRYTERIGKINFQQN